MNAAHVKYLTKAVPRYTSYPTVPHFTEAVGHGTYEGWLSCLDASNPISLYLHVPFCRRLCWYCGCNMKLVSREETVAQYVTTLMREIEILTEKLPARMTISHLHWGGGTPTSLAPDDLERAMDLVHSHFDFTPDAEIAVESDPRTLTDAMIARIGATGFNRASFGVQEFDPKVQAAINRIQPPEMVAKSVEGLRAAGVRNINFDLIYGLPHQSVDTLITTVGKCAAIRPDRLALFGYAHVPWLAKRQRLISIDVLPGATERFQQAESAGIELEKLGYVRIGLDHFGLPEDSLAIAAATGNLRRNFQGYTTDKACTLLGVGSTSIGRTPKGFVQNISETGAWARNVYSGTLPIAKGHSFSAEDLLRGEIIEQLMCFGAANIAETIESFECSEQVFADEFEELSQFASEGVVSLDNGILQVSEDARSLVRVVASVFDSYHRKNLARHSIAV